MSLLPKLGRTWTCHATSALQCRPTPQGLSLGLNTKENPMSDRLAIASIIVSLVILVLIVVNFWIV